MKKIICCLLVAVLSACVVGCGSAGTVATPTAEPLPITIPDDLHFGMKESEIINLYGSPSWEPGDFIVYRTDTEIANFNTQEMALYITKNGLEGVVYKFEYYGTRNLPFLADTETIKNELVKIFGDNYQYTEEWKNEKYKNDPPMWDKAISSRDLDIMYRWESEDYIVVLRTDDSGVSLYYTANTTEYKNIDLYYSLAD